jgi:hypothetical protein
MNHKLLCSAILLAALIGFPFLLQWLSKIDTDRGILWLFIHQLYYLPFSWLDKPFYAPDSDIGYWVRLPARILAALVYATLFVRLKIFFSNREQKQNRTF